MIVHNLPHTLRAVSGSGKTVAVTTVTSLSIDNQQCDGVLLQVYGDPVTVTTDGRTPEAGVVGRTYAPGYDLYLSLPDANRARLISAGTSSIDLEAVKAQ